MTGLADNSAKELTQQLTRHLLGAVREMVLDESRRQFALTLCEKGITVLRLIKRFLEECGPVKVEAERSLTNGKA
jgi:hypothetical protein